MADLSFKELEELFRQQLMELLGYSPRGEDLVRLIYQEDSQPFHSFSKDVCYFYLRPADEGINRQIDTTYSPLDETKAQQISSYNRVLELVISFYGPGAYDKAVLLRMDLLEPTRNYDLALAGLYVVPDVAEPFLSWENFNNRWWPRTDLTVRYNNTVTDRRHSVNYLASAAITVVSEQTERPITVKEGV